MVVLCAGMFRSGSTWQYQIACEILAREPRPLICYGYQHAPHVAEILADAHGDDCNHVLKTHEVIPSALDDTRGTVKALYSYRDLRDVVYSMAHKLHGDYRDAIDWHITEQCLEADAFWQAYPGVLLQRYEDWMGHTLPHILAIARHLEVTLSVADAEDLCVTYRLAKQKDRTIRIAEHLRAEGVDLDDRANALRNDAKSLLHWNHVREGQVGDWRDRATPAQLADLREKCGDWLIARGYETDHRWADRKRHAA